MTEDAGQAGLAAKYDRVAEKYAAAFFDELERKPFDRSLLDRFAAAVAGRGRVCDVGCGPGHVGRYLAARGVEVFGLDLSPRMVELARRLNPGIPFDEKISISATLFEPDEMRGYMEAAGLAVDDISARDPYDFEYPTRRVYAAATKR